MSERDREKLVRISDHLFHEIERMELYFDVLCLDQELGELRCALIDSFTIHARCLSEFLWDDKKKGYEKSDVRAADFMESDEWNPPTRTKFLKDWSDTMTDKRLAHLTFERLDIKKDEEKWPIGKIYREMKVALESFYEWVPKQNTGERLAARIDLVKDPDQFEVKRPINDPLTIDTAMGTSATHPTIVNFPNQEPSRE